MVQIFKKKIFKLKKKKKQGILNGHKRSKGSHGPGAKISQDVQHGQ